MKARSWYELNRVIDSFQIGEGFTTAEAMRRWSYKREMTLARMRTYLRTSDRLAYTQDPHHSGYWERIA